MIDFEILNKFLCPEGKERKRGQNNKKLEREPKSLPRRSISLSRTALKYWGEIRMRSAVSRTMVERRRQTERENRETSRSVWSSELDGDTTEKRSHRETEGHRCRAMAISFFLLSSASSSSFFFFCFFFFFSLSVFAFSDSKLVSENIYIYIHILKEGFFFSLF